MGLSKLGKFARIWKWGEEKSAVMAELDCYDLDMVNRGVTQPQGRGYVSIVMGKQKKRPPEIHIDAGLTLQSLDKLHAWAHDMLDEQEE